MSFSFNVAYDIKEFRNPSKDEKSAVLELRNSPQVEYSLVDVKFEFETDIFVTTMTCRVIL